MLILWFVTMSLGLRTVMCCFYFYHLMNTLDESQINTVGQQYQIVIFIKL